MKFIFIFVTVPFLMMATVSHATVCVTNNETLKITCSQPAGDTAVNNTEQAINERFKDCEAQISINKKFEILKGKIVLYNTADQPTEILANTKVPSSKEKAALSRWVEEQKLCSSPVIEYYNSQSPEIGAIFREAYDDLFISAADLYQGKVTFGDFARASVKRHQAVRKQIGVITATLHEKQVEGMQREAIARQQMVDRQRYIQHQRCESLRQEILSAERSADRIRQQQNANARARELEKDRLAFQLAQADPDTFTSFLAQSAGRGLGNIIGRALGGSDPELQAAEQQQEVLILQAAIYQSECN